MDSVESFVDEVDVDGDRAVHTLDVRDLPPPQPLQETLESLIELDADAVLVQINDRIPQFIFPQLEERGYRFRTFEEADAVVTVIWR
ncbi:MAG: DUF2249 domain-containing protein [Halobacteriota archaeon]